MNRLIKTALFSLLEDAKGSISPKGSDIVPAYDDFIESVISLCTSSKESVPAYFTLHYTLLKLEEFQDLLSDKRAEKKCACTGLHHPLPFVY